MGSGLVLGVDVGNAKLKLCVAGRGQPRWMSRPLPYDDRARYRRHRDFEVGVPPLVDEFLGDAKGEISLVVVVTSSGYAYPTYREGIVHTMALIARTVPAAECFALAHDGELVSASEIASGSPELLGALTFTNGVGAAVLARRLEWLGASGLVVDTGGTTSQVAAIVDGEIEPHVKIDRARYLEHRLRSGKAAWIGSQTLPLECLAPEVPVGDRRFPVLPRGVTFDAVVSALDLAPPELATKLSLFGLAPRKESALRAIADSVNLDANMASEEELIGLARHYLELAIDRLAGELRLALAASPAHARERALVFGLGGPWLTAPALRRAGVEEIALASRWLAPELAEVASCYGACHAGLERLAGRALSPC
ncbi:MAG: hypothetical protein KIT84_36560 [Labilithrix sp.]|nr:hypothetical protein [Labilithrix sp.]MCW5816569.1 hypothetical protein [Labilithrix sp.]